MPPARACAMPATELERILWVRHKNDRRKGRKGRKPPAAIRHVGFVNDINHLDVHCGSRFAPLGAAETGGNRRKLRAEALLENLSVFSLSHLGGPLKCLDWHIALAETAETPRAGPGPT